MTVRTSAAAAAFLSVDGLVRSFGTRRVLEEVTFTLDRGRVLAVFGPNGAGKTTLLRTLAGALRPHGGQVRLDGRSRADAGRSWFRRVGVVSHATFLWERLSVRENLETYAALFGVPNAAARIRDRLAAAGLAERAEQRAGALSRGLKQRVAITRALLHDPELVLLDEPFAGLDAAAAARLRQDLEALRDGHRAVILVTHDLREGRALADESAVLSRGRFHSMSASRADEVAFESEYHALVGRPA